MTERTTASTTTREGRPSTLGALRESGWTSRRVADELRANLETRIAAGEPLAVGILGFDDTVLPQLENAILAGHDVILLGERGQAKTRILRSLVELLDEWLPIVATSEINDDPYAPVSRHAIDLVAELGDETPIDWVHRAERYGEKLATPDTTISDLIGEVDPIKIAEGRYLSDERALSYGLVPRVNRGIFAINELPDLAERIQVGLLNVLEERDIQIRGHRIRLPLDLVLVATANPEDYTNRGRIITPLKDRFGAQIRTHYPSDVETELDIVHNEAALPPTSVPIVVPWFIERAVVEISQLARRSPLVNQRSGVSVRLTIANYESVVANALRRSLRTASDAVVPRVSDLGAVVASTQGKIEIEAMEEGREHEVVAQLVAASVLLVFREHVVLEDAAEVVATFDDEVVVHVGDDLAAQDYVEVLDALPALEPATRRIAGEDAGDEEMAASLEFLLEGLHLTKRLSKDASGPRALYRQRRR
ncbi:MAG TPA: AAA family ATPase [Acidimicrobiales bacterium]|jgi:magnesium chelatase subunit I|nr:AAA family ATPase [Acidimicrobiales bacterium]